MQTRDTGLARLSAAIRVFDDTRARLLRATGEVVAGANALDAADAACATGQTDAAQRARATARPAVARAKASLSALPGQLAAYDRALTALTATEKAATSLSSVQRRALDAVVAGGHAEAGVANAFRRAAVTGWPAYAALDDAQSTWLDRRVSGWYRSTSEAASAYAVQRIDDLPSLARARAELLRTNAAVLLAGDRERTALAAADSALAPLHSPA